MFTREAAVRKYKSRAAFKLIQVRRGTNKASFDLIHQLFCIFENWNLND